MDHKFKNLWSSQEVCRINTKCLSGNDNKYGKCIQNWCILNKVSNIYIVQFKTKDSRKDKVTKRSQRATVRLPIALKPEQNPKYLNLLLDDYQS